MARGVKLEIRPQEIIEAVKKMKKVEREAFVEDLLAATAPEYIRSIREARKDYREGRVETHGEVFGR